MEAGRTRGSVGNLEIDRLAPFRPGLVLWMRQDLVACRRFENHFFVRCNVTLCRRMMAVTALVLAQSAWALARAAQESSAAAASGDTIQVTAKKYEFNPAVITVKQGQRVRLVITATDRDHGFKLAAYNVEQKLKKGVATPVEFTADKAGTFAFACSEFCGLGHSHMKGKLVVEPAAAAASP